MTMFCGQKPIKWVSVTKSDFWNMPNTKADFVGHIKVHIEDEIEIIDTLGERVKLDKKN